MNVGEKRASSQTHTQQTKRNLSYDFFKKKNEMKRIFFLSRFSILVIVLCQWQLYIDFSYRFWTPLQSRVVAEMNMFYVENIFME